jgi:hypothetical protein
VTTRRLTPPEFQSKIHGAEDATMFFRAVSLLMKNTINTRAKRFLLLAVVCCVKLFLLGHALSLFRGRGSAAEAAGPGIDSQHGGDCVTLAEDRLRGFVGDIGEDCRDNQRQRACQRRMSETAVPNLMRTSTQLAAGGGGEGGQLCTRACPFHAVVSELGGEPLNQIAMVEACTS